MCIQTTGSIPCVGWPRSRAALRPSPARARGQQRLRSPRGSASCGAPAPHAQARPPPARKGTAPRRRPTPRALHSARKAPVAAHWTPQPSAGATGITARVGARGTPQSDMPAPMLQDRQLHHRWFLHKHENAQSAPSGATRRPARPGSGSRRAAWMCDARATCEAAKRALVHSAAPTAWHPSFQRMSAATPTWHGPASTRRQPSVPRPVVPHHRHWANQQPVLPAATGVLSCGLNAGRRSWTAE